MSGLVTAKLVTECSRCGWRSQPAPRPFGFCGQCGAVFEVVK